MEETEVAKEIATKVESLGGKTFYVGGFVRDNIISGGALSSTTSSKDVDIEIHGITAEKVYEILKSLDIGKVVQKGTTFGVFGISGYNLDISLPRREIALAGGGHKDFKIFIDPFTGYTSAARRRDFTMNAIMVNVKTGDIVDPFNGINDIKNKVIRIVDPNTFIEDPLRVFRAAQFASRLGFSVHNETVELCKSMKSSLSLLSGERVHEELKKALLKSERPSVFFEKLREMDALEFWFKELNSCIGCQQNPAWHPEGDVWVHTMNVVDNGAKTTMVDALPEDLKFPFMVGCLCHDYGKPSTTFFKEGKGLVSPGHDIAGESPARDFCNRIRCSNTETKIIVEMVVNHMRPGSLYKDNASQEAWNNWYDNIVFSDLLFKLCECDSRDASRWQKKVPYISEKIAEYERIMNQPYQIKNSELLNFGLSGKEFGEKVAFIRKQMLRGHHPVEIRKMLGMEIPVSVRIDCLADPNSTDAIKKYLKF